MLIVSTCQISASHYNLINFKIHSAGPAQFFAQLFHSVMCSSSFFFPPCHLTSSVISKVTESTLKVSSSHSCCTPPSLTCSPPVANVTSQEAASLFLWVHWHQNNCVAASRICGQFKCCQLAEVSCELNSLISPLAQRNLTLCLIWSDLTLVVCPKMRQVTSNTSSCDQQRGGRSVKHST